MVWFGLLDGYGYLVVSEFAECWVVADVYLGILFKCTAGYHAYPYLVFAALFTI